MKKIYKIIGITIFISSVLGFTIFKQQNQDNVLIIGTWAQEDDTTIRMTFTADGLVKDYVNGELIDTNNWHITSENTPSGLTISHLILTNTLDVNDVSRFEINALNNETLVLVFQRPDGSIAQANSYTRQ